MFLSVLDRSLEFEIAFNLAACVSIDFVQKFDITRNFQ